MLRGIRIEAHGAVLRVAVLEVAKGRAYTEGRLKLATKWVVLKAAHREQLMLRAIFVLNALGEQVSVRGSIIVNISEGDGAIGGPVTPSTLAARGSRRRGRQR